MQYVILVLFILACSMFVQSESQNLFAQDSPLRNKKRSTLQPEPLKRRDIHDGRLIHLPMGVDRYYDIYKGKFVPFLNDQEPELKLKPYIEEELNVPPPHIKEDYYLPLVGIFNKASRIQPKYTDPVDFKSLSDKEKSQYEQHYDKKRPIYFLGVQYSPYPDAPFNYDSHQGFLELIVDFWWSNALVKEKVLMVGGKNGVLTTFVAYNTVFRSKLREGGVFYYQSRLGSWYPNKMTKAFLNSACKKANKLKLLNCNNYNYQINKRLRKIAT